jgi:hypothetical protein
VVINDGRSITYSHTDDDDFGASDSFTYTISDGDLEDTATVTVAITGVNDPPTAVDDTAQTQEETPVTIDVTANDTDPDPGDAATLRVISVDTAAANGSVTISSNGRSLTYTPNNDRPQNATTENNSFTYVVADRSDATATASVTVTVTNIAPVANDDGFGDIGLSGSVSLNVFDNDTDGPVLNRGTGIQLTSVTYNGTSYAAGSSIDVLCGALSFATDGTITINREAIFCSGSEGLTYTITDSAGATDSAAVTWNFIGLATDDLMLASLPANQTDEDTSFSVSASGGVLAEAGSVWSVSTTGTVATLFGGSATVSANGAFSYTPPPNFTGSDSFAFTATGANPPAQGRGVVTVDPVNDAPLAQDDLYGVSAGGSLDLALEEGLLSNDIDLEGGSLAITTVDDGDLSGTLNVQANGAFSYTPLAASGNESFTYTVSDGSRSSTAQVTIAIGASPPFAAALSYTTNEDSGLNGNLGGSASAGGSSRFGGSVSVGAGGAFSYTPPPNFSGSDSFAYQLTSGGFTANGLVHISVSARADAPLAGDDFFTGGRDTPFSASTAGGLLRNDIDPDGNSLTITTTGIITTDQGGEAEIFSDGRFNYAPPTGFTGTDRFDYTVEDGSGSGDAATVIVTVVP